MGTTQSRVRADEGGRQRARPGRRKQLIIAAGADLFHRVGYHRVTVADIAAAAGITGSGVYRHFPSKQQILSRIVLDDVAQLAQVLEAGAVHDIPTAVHSLAGFAVDRRELGVLCQREARHLGQRDRAELEQRLWAVARRLADLVSRAQPARPSSDADLLARAVLSVLSSPSYSAAELPRARLHRVLSDLAAKLLEVRLLPTSANNEGNGHLNTAAQASSLPEGRVSRRETLLNTGAMLFAQIGYSNVTMEDVAATVGIAGPSIYSHFSSKADLLFAILIRGAEWLQMDLAQTLASAAHPAHALEMLIRSYARMGIVKGEFVDVLVREGNQLPDDKWHHIRHLQHDYVAEWVRLLLAARPELDELEARVTVQAILTLVNDLARTRPNRANHILPDNLVALGITILLPNPTEVYAH